jgi:hypothetical protein
MEGLAVPNRIFEVIVRGRLSPVLLAAFDGFEETRFDGGMTHLVGLVSDQEGLHRLFHQLLDLNIELVSVNAVADMIPPSS